MSLLNLHSQAVFGPDSDERLDLNALVRDQAETIMLQDRRRDELHLHQREAVADAHPRPATEGQVGVTVNRVTSFWTESVWIKLYFPLKLHELNAEYRKSKQAEDGRHWAK